MIELKNRFILAPLKLGYSDGTGLVTEKHLQFYNRRNKHIGAIIPEPFYMDAGLRELPTQLGIDHDDKIAGLLTLVEIIHRHGAKAIAHLNHPGRMANPKIPENYFWSSTAMACENGGAVPQSMDRGMMDRVIQNFTDAARRAVSAGFDMIELQLGHGYLLAQFLSPQVNHRTDEYGGDFENRIRFPLEVVQAVISVVDIPVIIRISGDEITPEGFHIGEMVHFARIMEKSGAAAIHVSAGSVCSTPPWALADTIREKIDIPVIYVGRINTNEDVDTLIHKHNAAYLAVGQSLIADPDFTGKYLGKVEGNIAPCLACAEGCLGGVKSGHGLQCLVNPEVGRESDIVKKASHNKTFAVVGGGLAGMETAIILKKRGHTVDLYESEELGGQFNLASLTPHKKSMATLVPYFIGEILLEKNLPRNKKVLIIGGGLIGVDIATALIPLENQVIIVKRTTDFGEDMELISKSLSLKIMKEKGTIFSDHTFITKIEGNTVFAERYGETIRFDSIDIIVVSTGMKSYNPLEKELAGKMPVYVIGDARAPGNAQDSIHGAYELAKNL